MGILDPLVPLGMAFLAFKIKDEVLRDPKNNPGKYHYARNILSLIIITCLLLTPLVAAASIGLVTVDTSIIPELNNTFSFGNSTHVWASGYFENLTVTSLFVSFLNGTLAGNVDGGGYNITNISFLDVGSLNATNISTINLTVVNITVSNITRADDVYTDNVWGLTSNTITVHNDTWLLDSNLVLGVGENTTTIGVWNDPLFGVQQQYQTTKIGQIFSTNQTSLDMILIGTNFSNSFAPTFFMAGWNASGISDAASYQINVDPDTDYITHRTDFHGWELETDDTLFMVRPKSNYEAQLGDGSHVFNELWVKDGYVTNTFTSSSLFVDSVGIDGESVYSSNDLTLNATSGTMTIQANNSIELRPTTYCPFQPNDTCGQWVNLTAGSIFGLEFIKFDMQDADFLSLESDNPDSGTNLTGLVFNAPPHLAILGMNRSSGETGWVTSGDWLLATNNANYSLLRYYTENNQTVNETQVISTTGLINSSLAVAPSGDLLLRPANRILAGDDLPSSNVKNVLSKGIFNYEGDEAGFVAWGIGAYNATNPTNGLAVYTQGASAHTDAPFGTPLTITRIGSGGTAKDNVGVLMRAQHFDADLTNVSFELELKTNDPGNTDSILGLSGNEMPSGTVIKLLNPSTVRAITATDPTLVCTNINADLVDGINGAEIMQRDGSVAMTGDLDLNGNGLLNLEDGSDPLGDANKYVLFGRAYVGDNGQSDFAGFGHRDQRTPSTYALMQYSNGITTLNGVGEIDFLLSNNEQMRLKSTGLGIGTISPDEKLDVGNGGKITVHSLGDDKSLDLSHDDTDANIYSTDGGLNFKASGDPDDYLSLSVTNSIIPKLTRVGGDEVYFECDAASQCSWIWRNVGNDGRITLDKTNSNFVINSRFPILFQPSEDINDYINFTTISDQPAIGFVGAGGKITADEGVVDFDDENITTTGTVKSGGFESNGNTGLTDSSSYWLCTSSDCSTTCQVEISGGIITGCT